MKALGGQAVSTVDLAMRGIDRDRAYAVVDADGSYLTSAECPRLLRLSAAIHDDDLEIAVGGGPALSLGAELDAAVSHWIGQAVRVRIADHATATPLPDAAFTLAEHLGVPASRLPVRLEEASHLHFLTTASMRLIERLHDGDRAEFRSSLLVDLDADGEHEHPPENAWIGREARVGRATMVLFGPPVRCCARHQPESTGLAKNTYGVHALVVSPGVVRVGDRVVIGGPAAEHAEEIRGRSES